ncbi:putative enoyl-CoA hydratase [Gordonia polyisoprenivorans NBRC 16320 = JCM 10675]|uniref:Enoyl-CoA hydratase/isomerase family protein n=1 Tax=Gordonia polyisoprenivorans TaxID=84595 RepID=A0A846WUN3_9ACTN|nr:enoyl-CoA hydratase/isomerase family protein [Gordonia polyisoprenivorans]NKY04450.1 enoyl-CoA hydratase/isomerase family protein [Gordonia polyisoprenivorans]OZC29484.1 enoyl-CoA hydratase [Gordonia polyisoprenivorans]GAB25475.1 putative enoyl-CoA hydratase [Gordonia polyisoprenivorans NBRC 16320 = JCM 10675]
MTAKGYPDYESLDLDYPVPHVLRIMMDRPPMNSLDFQMHQDLSAIWQLIDADPEVSAVVIGGRGRAYSAGGDFDMVQRIIDDYDFRCQMWKEGRSLVRNMLNCGKPIVSAISGAAAGGGLATALLADVSIAGKTAKIVDGHTNLGVAADDHAVAIWPLLCGLSKAKYYLMTSEPLTGEEAERIGLVTFCVADELVDERSLEVAAKLAKGAPSAIRWTKQSLNNWVQSAWPAFEASLAFGILGFTGPEAAEGLSALQDKRAPQFPQRSFI